MTVVEMSSVPETLIKSLAISRDDLQIKLKILKVLKKLSSNSGNLSPAPTCRPMLVVVVGPAKVSNPMVVGGPSMVVTSHSCRRAYVACDDHR